MTSTRRKSTLFLTEQLIVIAVFALCAIACINILTTAFFMARDSKDTANALIAAQNCAEVFKATGGDIEVVYKTFSNRNNLSFDNAGDNFTFSIYLNDEWTEQIGVNAQSAQFIMTLTGSIGYHAGNSKLITGEISISRTSGENLVTLPVAVRSK